MIVSLEEFDRWIQEALAELPPRFAALAEEVSIVVEEEPSREVLRDLELNQKTICWVSIKASRLMRHRSSSLPVSCPPVSPSIVALSYVSVGQKQKSFKRSATR